MNAAFESFLSLLPECNCSRAGLRRAAEYFEITPNDILAAAGALPENHDLKYRGVRLLISACLEEFASLFENEKRELCEVTVPAPPILIYALQEANPEVHFTSGAFFCQFVLRGLFLHREPIDLTSCSKRCCGLNKLRQRLFLEPPIKCPERLLQFGVLCDECVKASESLCGTTKQLSLTFPKQCRFDSGFATKKAEEFISQLCLYFGTEILPEHKKAAFSMYGRLMKAENRLSELIARNDGTALKGNSLALAQSVQLMSADRVGAMVESLKTLISELEHEPPTKKAAQRIYCFFIPLLQPEIDSRFRENGVELVGGAAFIQGRVSPGFDLPYMLAAWLEAMSIRRSTKEECAAIAQNMQLYGCKTYMTGAFGFDRWLGAAVPLQRRILKEEHGINTVLLDVDFWSESCMFGSFESRIDGICATEKARI